ncbi:hypothetical protein L1887_11346 [Cichorium endivia]|nr:hypothetical protein L1887_11346 [Cichorium endivia]
MSNQNLQIFSSLTFLFRTGNKGNEDLFDKLDTSTLNAHLKELMPGLTAKVFRTYNASITLDDMLNRDTKGGGHIAENVVVYKQTNKEINPDSARG